jgi:hypothetical protein
VICGAPINAAGLETAPASDPTWHCRTLSCIGQYQQVRARLEKNQLARCNICGVLLPQVASSTGFCSDRDCLVLQTAQRGRAQRAVREADYARLKTAATTLREQRANQVGLADSTNYLPIVVPHQSAGLVPQDPSRVATRRSWLGTISEMLEAPRTHAARQPLTSEDQPESDDARHLAVYRLGCRLCRGSCCQHGGNTAYLDRNAFARAWAAAPARSRDQLIEDYLARLPEQSVAGSCVYHSEFGCVLPRVMRSHICNQFLCAALMDAQLKMTAEGCETFFVASADGDHLVTGELLHVREATGG